MPGNESRSPIRSGSPHSLACNNAARRMASNQVYARRLESLTDGGVRKPWAPKEDQALEGARNCTKRTLTNVEKDDLGTPPTSLIE
jgi:hypothetical protein